MKKQIKRILLVASLAVCLILLASCTFPMTQTHTCADANGDTKCDTCQAYVAPKACTAHIDNNNDGVCDRAGCNGVVLKEMLDVTFENVTKTYNGKEWTIEVEGAPEGAEIDYDKSNKQTNAGKYTINAYITCDGYVDTELTATLTIKPKKIDITFGELPESFPSNGNAPEISYTLDGILEGDEVEVEFDFGKCDFTELGTFTAKALSKNANYEVNTKNKANEIKFVMGENVHTVTFQTGVESTTLDDEVVVDGEAIEAPRVILNLGYEFLGWYNGDVQWNFDNPVTENLTLVAKWKTVDYNITYFLNGGENNSENPDGYTVETGAKILAPTREGRVFLGWYTDAAYSAAFRGIEAGKSAKDVYLYAKWSDEIVNGVMSADDLAKPLASKKYLASGKFNFIFSANVTELGDDGVIYIGRGKDIVGGAYIRITSNKVELVINTADGTTVDSKTHVRSLDDYITVDITVNNGSARVLLRTSDGETSINYTDFICKNGEIFASCENAELSDVGFAWSAESSDQPIWILGEASESIDNEKSFVKNLVESGYINALVLSADGLDSGDVLEGFKAFLELSVPEYALWVFPTESGADYDLALAEFISVCKENEIIPVLTTHIGEANAEKNAAVLESGEIYIDFASLSSYEGIYDNGYTKLGAESLFAKLIVDLPELLTPGVLVDKAEAEVLNSENETLVIANNKVKDGKVVIFTAKLNGELKEGESLIIGHGYGSTYSAWAEITSDKIISYNQGAKSDSEPGKSIASHNLTIKNYITVITVQDKAEDIGYKMTVITDGGSYSRSLRGNPCNGNISANVLGGLELTEVKASFSCLDYDAPIWIFGASYFSLGDSARWPYYMYADGFAKEVLMVGRGGLNTTGGLIELKDALRHATPEMILWGYGMNDGKDGGDINQTTYKNHIEFLEICKQNNITPVFLSSVNCTTNIHTHKIDYVDNRLGDFANYDYRVASLPHAVNGYEEGSEWYDGMLSGDGIHPTELGARNFYLEILAHLPELMLGVDSTVKTEKADALGSAELKIKECPEFIDGDMAISLSVDYDGDLDGDIFVGNGKGVEGGTWVKINEDKVEVYTTVAGVDVLVAEADNKIKMQDILMLRILVRDNSAKISFVSAGENNYTTDSGALFTVEAPWSYAGEVFLKGEGVDLSNAILNFAIE